MSFVGRKKVFENLKLALAVGVTFLPFIIWLFLIGRYGVNIPLSDAWHVPGTQIAAYFQGKFQASLLFEQHNESRKVIPTLIFMLLPILTGEWNTRWEMFLGLAFAGIMSLLVFLLLQRTNRGHLYQNLMLVFFYNCLMLCLRAHFRWLNGITLHRLLPDACLLLNALIFTFNLSAPIKTVIFIALAIVAQYSFGGGIIIWFCSLILVLALKCQLRIQKVWLVLSYSFCFSLSSAFYFFWNYHKPEGQPSPLEILKLPLTYIFRMGFAFLGNGITSLGTLQPIVGCILVLAFLGICCYWRKVVLSPAILPWVVLGTYPIFLAPLNLMLRLPLAKEHVVATRYITHLVYLPLALLALAYILANQQKIPRLRRLAMIFMGLLFALYISANFNQGEFNEFAHFYRILQQGKTCVQMANFYRLEDCGVDETAGGTSQVYLLNQLGLLRPGIAKSLNFESKPGDWGTLEGWQKIPEGILFGGTAKLEQRPADAIVLMQQIPGETPHILTIWPMELEGDHVSFKVNSNDWRKVLRNGRLSEVKDICSLRAYAVDTDNNRLLPLKRGERMKAACKY